MRNNYSTSHKEKDKNNYSNFSLDLSLLTDTQQALIETIRRECVPQVLKDQRLLEDNTYKANLMINDVDKVIHHMEFFVKHPQRIQKMELDLIKLWESHNTEMDSSRKSILHEHLVAFQSYLSAYYLELTDKLSENKSSKKT